MRNLHLSLLLMLWLTSVLMPAPSHAAPQCSAEQRITKNFDNGAQWDLCWESRIRENLVLSDVYYTPADGPPLRVLSSARLSQLHVAYDDSDVTYNDVTQYGLGGSYLVTLTQTDCPQGTLLTVQTRAVLCVWRTSADNRYRTPTRAASSQSLNLFSVSQVGAYTYITSWIFYDDGAIEPGIGATGALQRSSADLELPFGRVLQGDPDTLWLSHTHSYYWRLDFDLGASATDDVVSELRYQRNTQGRRELQTTVFTTEQARRIEPDTHQMWRISEHAAADAAAYDIEPTRHGHRFERKEVEPYTDYDFFVTVGKDCERFASQNSRFNPECQNHVLEYVDGQPLQNEDLIVWHRVSFHHVPRSEDQRHMHTHWDGFKMRPANVHTATSGLANIANTVPVFSEISDRRNRPGDHVHVTLNATDSDGDVLSYTASGLPDGLSIDINGLLHGETKLAGVYRVTVKAQDDHSAGSASFDWVVDASGSDNGAVKTGAFNVWCALLGVLFLILRRRPQAPHRCASALPPLRSLHHRQFF